MALSNAMLQGKLKGTQCSETVKSRVSTIIIIMICMKLRFSSCSRAKAGRWGHKALPKHSPAVNWQHRRTFPIRWLWLLKEKPTTIWYFSKGVNDK